MGTQVQLHSRSKAASSLVMVLALLSCAIGRAQAPPEIPPADAGYVAVANFTFAVELYSQLAQDPETKTANLLFSPFSASTALAILAEGAHGRTAEQMNSVLHFYDAIRVNHPDAGTEPSLLPVHESIAWSTRQWATGPAAPYEMGIFNSVLIDQSYPIVSGFQSKIEQHYGKDVICTADFIGNLAAEREKFNEQVRARTGNRISDLFPETLAPKARVLIANAALFKGTWLNGFDKAATNSQAFHVDAKRTVSTSLMHRGPARLPYLSVAGFAMVALPYRGKTPEPEMSMIVMLPGENDGLPNLERTLDARRLEDWLPRMEEQPVEVYLPRFQLSRQYDLAGILSKMGMGDAFSSQADFSGISPQAKRDQVRVSMVAHKAFVDVNEEGTEAAAATGIVGGAGGRGPTREIRPPVFRADHPFLFFIYHHPTGTILFMGRLNNPAG